MAVSTRSKATSSDSINTTNNSGDKSTSKGDQDAANSLVVNGVPIDVYKRNIALGFLASFTFIGLLSWIILSGTVNLAGSVNADKLNGYGLKAEFTFRYLILGAAFLVFNVQAVISKRVGTAALDPLNGREDLTLANRNILQNSLEQFVITVVSQLSLISYLPGVQVVRVIPLLNFLFFFGRIAFFVGYPRYRTFGFITTWVPTIAANSYSLYKFGSHLGIY